VCVCVHLNSIHTERFDCSYKHLLGGRLTAVRSAVVEFCHPGSTETRPQCRQQHLVNWTTVVTSLMTATLTKIDCQWQSMVSACCQLTSQTLMLRLGQCQGTPYHHACTPHNPQLPSQLQSKVNMTLYTESDLPLSAQHGTCQPNHTNLNATQHVYHHMEWAILPSLPSHKASLYFGQNSFSVRLRAEGWVRFESGSHHTTVRHVSDITTHWLLSESKLQPLYCRPPPHVQFPAIIECKSKKNTTHLTL